jgi:translation initiation factor 4E
MPEGTTINLFVRGIKPVWEDIEHSEGASLRFQFSKGYANQIWEDLILAFIGEQFECADEVTGIALSVGRTDKLSIWFRHGYDSRVSQ